ncbi:Puromycin-sensitive aminopeptidase [Artemisia annua]|uniref:Puromycin-sensitive aminopeptidase n=1 Tax=Artemisia annua TaxID=35608 RepID=A0A2U1N5I2_ARTAN|nr:Puromycin-sensitive aminopeptidase [Artemisia annua]
MAALSIVVTGEVEHQWFGNLATLEWWTHLWLIKDFATWKYACKNAKTEDLWSVISEESGVKVNKLMDIWTNQTGYPLTQPNGNKNQEVAEKPWVKVNAGHTGFYRVKYNNALTAGLRKATKEKCLSPEDKFGMPCFFYLDNKLIEALKFGCVACYNAAKILKDTVLFMIHGVILTSSFLISSYHPPTICEKLGLEQTHRRLFVFFRLLTYINDKNTSAFLVDIRKVNIKS